MAWRTARHHRESENSPVPDLTVRVEALGAFADAAFRRAVLTRRLLTDDGALDNLVLGLPGYRDDAVVRKVHSEVDGDLRQARKVLADEVASYSPFGVLCRHAGLTTSEVELLALLVATELDPTRQRLVVALGGDRAGGINRRLLDELLGADHSGAHDLERRLAAAGLLYVVGEGSWGGINVVVAPGVVAAALGVPFEEPGLSHWRELPTHGSGRIATLLVAGADPGSRRLTAAELSRASRLVVIEQPTDESGWSAAVRVATMQGAGLMVEVGSSLEPMGRRWVERARHLDWVISSDHDLPLDSVPQCEWLERRVLHTPPESGRLATLIGPDAAKGRRIDADQLELLERALPGLEDPTSALRRLASGDLDRLAERIAPRFALADLILDDDQHQRVAEILRRYRMRNRVYQEWGFRAAGSVGVTALMSGAPGTGKTMSAEVIAAELGLDLFRIELSATVSKYIGETEKNLEAIFRAADAADVVLLFDEADSLFTKRGEVSDAQDRYANMETSYLLQRLERFPGVAILTTNLSSNIDPAFMRRIHVSITFPVPEAAERLRIWKTCLPSGAPVGELDLDFVSQAFKISGGSIRNVVVAAAFLAAEEGEVLGMRHLVRSLRWEAMKNNRIIEPSQYGPYASLL